MKINFSIPITDLDGSPVPEGLTLGLVSVNALLATLIDPSGRPEQLSGAEKVEHAILAKKIHTNADTPLRAEEISLLKDRIGKTYPPLVVMQAWELLDPTE